MAAMVWAILAVAALASMGAVARALMRGPRPGDIGAAILWRVSRVYARVVHRARYEGLEHVPASGPVVFVANHTAGIDPVLVQAACPYEIRWIMAEDMRHPAAESLWRWLRIVFVDRAGERSEVGAMREAARHVRSGGALGIFPEGGIERPQRRLKPFLPGVGVLVRQAGAVVVPVVIEGTPEVSTAWRSLWRPSRARVRFLPPMRMDREMRPAEIASALRAEFQRATGWPTAE